MKASFEQQRQALEARYLVLLKSALLRCAAGRWGLFGRNVPAIASIGKYPSTWFDDPEVNELLETGDAIATARAKLGIFETFEPHRRLLELRGTATANTPGEPKLARQWLDEMKEE